jgi:hypothetical protein
MAYADAHRSPKNRHEWVEREPLETGDTFNILRAEVNGKLRGWRTDYHCQRCGDFPRCPSDFFDMLVPPPPPERGCVALPAPSVAPPVDVRALPVVASGAGECRNLPVVSEENDGFLGEHAEWDFHAQTGTKATATVGASV